MVEDGSNYLSITYIPSRQHKKAEEILISQFFNFLMIHSSSVYVKNTKFYTELSRQVLETYFDNINVSEQNPELSFSPFHSPTVLIKAVSV